jgi:hypothetical protein
MTSTITSEQTSPIQQTPMSRSLSSEAIAAAFKKAGPFLTIQIPNMDFKETMAPPPSPVDFDWSPASTEGSPSNESDALSWTYFSPRKEMHSVAA